MTYVDLYAEVLQPMGIISRAANPHDLLHLVLIQLLLHVDNNHTIMLLGLLSKLIIL
mgnify:CR=1 FL=1